MTASQLLQFISDWGQMGQFLQDIILPNDPSDFVPECHHDISVSKQHCLILAYMEYRKHKKY